MQHTWTQLQRYEDNLKLTANYNCTNDIFIKYILYIILCKCGQGYERVIPVNFLMLAAQRDRSLLHDQQHKI